MKKVFATVIVLALATVLSLGMVFASDPVTMDFVKGATTDNTEGPNGFFGPYDDGDSVKLDANDGLTIDMSVKEAWVTAEISPQEVDMYKYAVVVAKTDDVEAVTGFTIKFGDVGMLWQDWNSAAGKVPMITTDYQTYVFDLSTKDENGRAPGAADGSTIVTRGPEFALNQGEAKGGHVYVKSVTFTDELPAEYVTEPGAQANTTVDNAENTTAADNNATTVAPTQAAESNSSSTGMIIAIVAVVAVVVVVVIVIAVVASKKKK